MKRLRPALVAATALLVFSSALSLSAAPAERRLIPAAAVCDVRPGSFVVGRGTAIVFDGAGADAVARVLANRLQAACRLQLDVRAASAGDATSNAIRLTCVQGGSANAEGYTLDVAATGASLRASSAAGLFYAAETFLQLPAAGAPATSDARLEVPAVHIEDAPRFGWRGLLLDESRHFFGKKTVLELLDVMASLKLNRFHWHLTDEPGWRIEIKKYPKLTTVGSIGSWDNMNTPPSFYTQDDIREIVAYAAERHIMIVPEIDMPGHATAATRAYPELSGGGKAPWVGFTFNPGREQTYQFLEDVLREVVSLFPGDYVHLGGDEVSFGNQSWSTDPEILKFTVDHGLKSPVELERYFVRRMAGVVRSLGKTVMGWDEIAEAGVPVGGSAVTWWRHDKTQVLQNLLNNGYAIVLTPRVPLYLDFVQYETHQHGRRWKNGEFSPWERIYAYPDDTVNALIAAAKPSQILGLEACLWTERVQSHDRMWFMTLPRLAALAEAAWTPATAKDQADFARRLKAFLREMDRRGIPYFDPFDPERTPEPAGPTKKATGTANG